MPKLLGLNVVAVLAAAIAFYVLGYVWYAVLFESQWLTAIAMTKSQTEAAMSPMWMGVGALITIAQVVGIALVLKWRNAATLVSAVGTSGVIWLVLGLPIVAYAYAYMPAHSEMLLAIDGAHLLLGWALSAAILSLLKV
jgi:hypothetical protein